MDSTHAAGQAHPSPPHLFNSDTLCTTKVYSETGRQHHGRPTRNYTRPGTRELPSLANQSVVMNVPIHRHILRYCYWLRRRHLPVPHLFISSRHADEGSVNADPTPENERNNMLPAMMFSSTVRLSAGRLESRVGLVLQGPH